MGSEAIILSRKQDAILWGGTLASFTDTSLLLARKKVSFVTVWDKTVSQLKVWAVICTVFLGNVNRQPATFDMATLIKEKDIVCPCIQSHAHFQTDSSDALLRLIHTEFNRIFHQALER